MRVLALDISSSAGFAVMEGVRSDPDALVAIVGKPKLVEYGAVTNSMRVKDYAPHPFGYLSAAIDMAKKLHAIVERVNPDVVVIEETNGARARFTQKYLEYMHFAFLVAVPTERTYEVVYVNTSDWRRAMNVCLTPDDKKRNAKLSRAKSKSKLRGTKLDKKSLGISGRITIKHVAVRRANEEFGLALLAKDDDPADATLLAAAYLRGVKLCDGA